MALVSFLSGGYNLHRFSDAIGLVLVDFFYRHFKETMFSIFTKIYKKDNRVNSLARIAFGCDSFVAI